MGLSITRLNSGGFMCTYRCNSRCRHCAYFSGSSWPADCADTRTVRRVARKLRELGCASVHIGGGEPFLDIDGLIDVVSTLRASGLGIDYIETNAAWFRDRDSAAVVLGSLLKAGARMLLVSISPFHNEYIPFRKTIGLMETCESVGMSVFPWGSQFIDEMSALDPDHTHSIEEYASRFGDDYLSSIPGRYWVEMRGRAISTFGPFNEPQTADEIAAANGPCRELEDVSHFHVDLYENYVPGVCSGLSVDTADLGGPVDPERYPFLTTLADGGVSALLEEASARHGFEPRNTYAGKCDLCYDIRRHLIDSGMESRDLEPRFLYRFVPSRVEDSRGA